VNHTADTGVAVRDEACVVPRSRSVELEHTADTGVVVRARRVWSRNRSVELGHAVNTGVAVRDEACVWFPEAGA